MGHWKRIHGVHKFGIWIRGLKNTLYMKRRKRRWIQTSLYCIESYWSCCILLWCWRVISFTLKHRVVCKQPTVHINWTFAIRLDILWRIIAWKLKPTITTTTIINIISNRNIGSHIQKKKKKKEHKHENGKKKNCCCCCVPINVVCVWWSSVPSIQFLLVANNSYVLWAVSCDDHWSCSSLSLAFI